YGDQPSGWEVLGPKENIRKFSLEDFTSYLDSQYGSQNMVVCVAGKIDKKINALVEKYFGNFKKTKIRNKLPIIDKQSRANHLIKTKKTDQAHISLGVRSYGMCHKNEYALKVMTVLLGGSLSSRMFMSLREQRGLAYYVRTGSEFYTDAGYMTTQAGVPVDKVKESMDVILKEYKKLKTELVGKEELQRVKDLINGRVAIQLESSDSNANWYAKQLLLQNKVVTPDEYLKKINKVSPKDLMRVANEIFVNNRLNFAVIGPYADKKEFDGLLVV
ncbi:MAG: pitrilysin family protein, partial [Patescibacteria group bacterium]